MATGRFPQRVRRWFGTIFGLTTYLRRLSTAFGWRYVAVVILTYGINQGAGEAFIYGAQQYFLMDVVGMDAVQFGRLTGAAQVPWHLKSLFGLLSDTVPLFGRRRAPYMIIAGSLGLGSALLLSTVPPVGARDVSYAELRQHGYREEDSDSQVHVAQLSKNIEGRVQM